MKPRRKPLTLRLLEAMQTACSQLAAGQPEEVEGYATEEEADEMHAKISEAAEWLKAEIERREARRKRK